MLRVETRKAIEAQWGITNAMDIEKLIRKQSQEQID